MKRTRLFLVTAGTALALLAAGCGQPKPVETPNQTNEPAAQEQTQPAAVATSSVEAATTTPTETVAAEKPTVQTTQTKPTAAATKPTTKTPPPTQQQVIANQIAPQTIYVTIKAGAFSPQVVSVKAGGTVVWTNKDTVPHTTRSDGSLLWDSGTLQPNATFKHVFNATGSYKYSCAANPEMKGTVYVY
jgi:plastocyanin